MRNDSSLSSSLPRLAKSHVDPRNAVITWGFYSKALLALAKTDASYAPAGSG
ncbi:hypothetical protein SC1_01321 [Sphingopyxis sp. C-1]|nr:hypothetical protein SC1_01321 [Sphingopyxis sp. C-1]